MTVLCLNESEYEGSWTPRDICSSIRQVHRELQISAGWRVRYLQVNRTSETLSKTRRSKVVSRAVATRALLRVSITSAVQCFSFFTGVLL